MKKITLLLSIVALAAVAIMVTGFVPETYADEAGSSAALSSLDRSNDLAMGGGRQRGEETKQGTTDSGTSGSTGTGTTSGADTTRGGSDTQEAYPKTDPETGATQLGGDGGGAGSGGGSGGSGGGS